jgi:hypothetical protein
MSGQRLANGLVAALVLAVAALGWRGAVAAGPLVGYDSEAHVAYAQVLADQRRFPTESQTYEYTLPPLYPAAAVAFQAVANESRLDGIGDVAAGGPATAAWLAAGLLAVVLLVRFRRGAPGHATGFALAAAVVVAAVIAALGLSADVKWSGGQFLSIAWACGFVALSYRLARVVWPTRPLVAALAATVTAGLTVTLRMASMFHPEMQFACLVAVALVLVAQAQQRDWPPWYGLAAGSALGLAALTRQSAILAILALGAIVLPAARPRSPRFLAAAAAAIALLAGWWWVRQAVEYGNPVQANLDRYILEDGQPRQFYVSAPLEDLALRPYRPHFAGELWPQFHADLWADWFGAQHDFWPKPPAGATRFFASTQSVLGFPLAALAVGGLVAFGGGALRRVLERRARSSRDVALAACLVLAAASWAAFVIQLVRFPQGGGDPIKPTYLLYLAPAFAIGGVLAARWLWRRGIAWRVGLAALAVLWAASYAGYLVTAYP